MKAASQAKQSSEPPQEAGRVDATDAATHDDVIAEAISFLDEYARGLPEKPGARDLLHERYQINISTPLPEFDSALGRAYSVTDKTEPSQELYALVCAN